MYENEGQYDENMNIRRHRQPATGLLEWTVQLHYGGGSVDTTSPPITQAQCDDLRAKSGNVANFSSAAASYFGTTWWNSLTSLAVPNGQPAWQEAVRLDFAVAP